ncbi:VIP peptides-like [Eptesicus fuscus]|uniref:VIP peptides-like n=1 Tax=Eptesicus fuscus TaxID=29078 RepID=UPI0024048B20|nr:VIP peptides-like [Eptesicus fuscus]
MGLEEDEEGTEMETKKNSQLLVPLILLSVLFSQTLALPLVEAEALSNDISEGQRPIKRQADAILLKDYTRFPQQNPENEYLEEVIGKKSMLFTEILALFVEAEALRNVRHADGVSTSDISSLLDHHSPKDYSESLIEKRASNDISEDQRPVKRQSDSEFSAAFNLFLQKKKFKKQPKKKLRRIRSQKDDSKSNSLKES